GSSFSGGSAGSLPRSGAARRRLQAVSGRLTFMAGLSGTLPVLRIGGALELTQRTGLFPQPPHFGGRQRAVEHREFIEEAQVVDREVDARAIEVPLHGKLAAFKPPDRLAID